MAQMERRDVSRYYYYLDEPGGASKKHWIEDPNDGSKWLFKSVRIHKNGHRTTSDLSEVAAYRVANVIGIPAAEYALAVRDGEEGCISRDIGLPGYELDEGWKWIRSHHASLIPSVVRGTDDPPVRQPSGYSYENLRACLTGLKSPPGFETVPDGYTLFCGYLLLDALVANTDRHEANWGVMRAPTGSDRRDLLAPTFDHGAGLGYQLLDSKKQELLEIREDLSAWCDRGKAMRFAKTVGGNTLTLVDYFVQASRLADHATVGHWIDNVRSELTADELERLLPPVAGMSEVSTKFAIEVIAENVRRVLDGIR
ncbi:HipA domain-containing protein [Leucobacter soli]|uniref:HipA-like C-terminal domain-containing protein n=1 Tax=Leucobacter soli TaxID=2812850 RepID=A0A916K147_9MICO|nr:HipA domain-containing protein [Leucobacter soli]CAG7619220.1 hypothetical protein LEUCIP111803_02275 [Leucobacter soli]